MSDLFTADLYQAVALALGIGLMFGVERGWRQRERPAGSRAAGVRTFALIGLLGGIAGVLSLVMGELITVALLAAVAAFVLAGHLTGADQPRDRSITSGIAALLTFALGVLAVRGDMVLAAAAAVVAVALLDLREPLHATIRQIEKSELTAAIKLLLVSVVVLPILPDRGYGPGAVLNPYEIWWMVVLVASFSFAGYAAVRTIGAHRGLLLTGALGGIASSTAFTVTAARLAAANGGLAPACAAATAASIAVSVVRTLILAMILAPATGIALAPALTGAALGAIAAMIWHHRVAQAAPRASGPLDLGTPGDLGLALKFAAFLAAFTVAAWYARAQLGDFGVVGAAAISGLIDVDAVTVSLTRSADAAAINGILVAVAVNVAIKLAYATSIAGRAMAPPMLVVIVAAFVGMFLGIFLGMFLGIAGWPA